MRTCRSNFCPDHQSKGAPYLARFSRDVGYHGCRSTFFGSPGTANRGPWYPTSREKRARYGAPFDSWHHEILPPASSHADILVGHGFVCLKNRSPTNKHRYICWLRRPRTVLCACIFFLPPTHDCLAELPCQSTAASRRLVLFLSVSVCVLF